jgi:hypothetical protein
MKLVMKITEIPIIAQNQSGVGTAADHFLTKGTSFPALFDSMLNSFEFGGGFLHKSGLIQRVSGSKGALNPRDLLLLQVHMGRFNLHVEMVSKVAESGAATIRKLQNAQ